LIFIIATLNTHTDPPTPTTYVYKDLPFAAPEHSLIDLTASCPRCLAKAASKPNGSEGECECVFVPMCAMCVLCVSGYSECRQTWCYSCNPNDPIRSMRTIPL